MIIYNLKKIKKFSKKYIIEYENTLNFNIFSCPHCKSNKLEKWGKYTRNIIYYKNNQKYEDVIEIKRFRCKNCNKTQSVIPNFLVPYKIHITEYIPDTIESIMTSGNKITCEKYKISRQLLKYWLDCFEEHFTRISITLCETRKIKAIRQISKSMYDFIYKYYYENKVIYMMHMSDNYNMPILKWAPT